MTLQLRTMVAAEAAGRTPLTTKGLRQRDSARLYGSAKLTAAEETFAKAIFGFLEFRDFVIDFGSGYIDLVG